MDERSVIGASTQAIAPSPSLENCEAVIVSLRSRRFVIVYRDRPIPLLPKDRVCRSIRTLQQGDEVFYKGKTDTVEALCVY